MPDSIHIFDNGVKVYDYHLISEQRQRYQKQNVHEADEENIFVEIIKSLPADGCYLSIGSAIGYYPILAKKLSPNLTIHAVEPLSSHRNYFVENIELNNLHLDDFCIYQEGISSSEGYEVFLDAGYGSKILKESNQKKSLKYLMKVAMKVLPAFPELKKRQKNLQKEVKIKTITLDKLMEIVGKNADLVQMDVQGLETDILNSGFSSLNKGAIKTFLVGTHGLDKHQNCLDILQEHQYSIEFEESQTQNQPDGIIVASKGVQRLKK